MKNVVIRLSKERTSRREAGNAHYYLGKGLGFGPKAAAIRYTESGAKKIAQQLADYYGRQMTLERVTTEGRESIGTVKKGRKGNPVPPSSRAGRHQHATDKQGKARDLYQRFSGNKPWKKARTIREESADTFLQVGTVDGILYTTNRDGKVEQYIHHFRPASRPALLVSHDGKIARTLGGKFTFTERGFVDEDRDGNPVE